MPTTVLTESSSTTNTTSYTTASVSPAAGVGLVLVVGTSISSGVAPLPVISGLGLTWTLIQSSMAARGMSMYAAVGTATPGTITIGAPAGTTWTSGFWCLLQLTEPDTTGFQGVGNPDSGSGTSATTVLTETPLATSTTVSAAFLAIQTPGSAETGWTLATQQNQSAPTSTLLVQFIDEGRQQGTLSWTGGSTNYRGIICAFRHATTTPPVVTDFRGWGQPAVY